MAAVDPGTWGKVDHFVEDLLIPHDAHLEAALADMKAAELPPIQVSPLQGALLHILARTLEPSRILEIGTLGGYSTIWLGRALRPGGRLVTLELQARHAEVARVNLARAGLAASVEVRVGAALETLPRLAEQGFAPCDLVFIDADKPNTTNYFEWALKLTRPGGLIVVDNVVRQGQLADPTSSDANVQGMRRFVERLALETRTRSTVVQTVGRKGYDGFALAYVSPREQPP